MQDFKSIWKKLQNPSAADMVSLCVLKAMNAKSNGDRVAIAKALLSKAFTPITNRNKLRCSAMGPFDGLRDAVANARWGTRDFEKSEIIGAKATFIFDTLAEFQEYARILMELKDVHNEDLNRHYCYVFVDIESATPEQVMVQASHATMVVGSKMDKRFDPHKVFYQIVERPKHFDHRVLESIHGNLKFHHFVEPDLGNKVIASATEPVLWSKRRGLSDYPLVQFNKMFAA